jgi:DNA-binding response OmpR family regulator
LERDLFYLIFVPSGKADMENMNNTILCIDDDQDTCELVSFMFNETGYKMTSCRTVEEGLLYARKKSFGAIILDNSFEKTSGTEICREIRSFDQTTPIIFFSGRAFPVDKDNGLAAGANAYLVKPNDLEQLTETVIGLILRAGRLAKTADPR